MSVHGSQHSDQALAEEMKEHHGVMVAELDRLSGRLESAAATGADAAESTQALVDWIGHVLVPHAEKEEQTTYRGAAELPEGRLLIASLMAEHVLIHRLVALFAAAPHPVAAASYARALWEVFSSHQRKENEMVLPLLVAEEAVSLTDVMSGVHGHGHSDALGHAH